MILSAAIVVSALSLFSCSHALTLNVRQDDCPLVCPEKDADGKGLSKFSFDDRTMSCSYDGEPGNSCVYDTVSVDSSAMRNLTHAVVQTTGTVIGDHDGCTKEAGWKSSSHRSRELKQVVARRGAHDGLPNDQYPSPSATWKSHGAPSSHPKRAAPSPTWDGGHRSQSNSKSRPSPSHSPTWDEGHQSDSKSRPTPSHSPTWDEGHQSNSKSRSSPSPSPTWDEGHQSDSKSRSSPSPSASSHPKRAAPSPTWDGGHQSDSKSRSSPSHSPTWDEGHQSNSKSRPSPSHSPTWDEGHQSNSKSRTSPSPSASSYHKRAAPSPTWDGGHQSDSKSRSSPSPNPTWDEGHQSNSKSRSSPSPSASSHYKRAAPSPTWDGGHQSDSKSRPSPSPSPTWKSETQPPKQKPDNYKCPQQDLAKNLLTDEVIQDSSLLCNYSSDCKCKYSTVRWVAERESQYIDGQFQRTGLLLEDNNDGNCPQTATAVRPMDRRYI